MQKYTLTKEHRATLPMWREKWIANCLSTAQMSAVEGQNMVAAINCLYEDAGFKPLHLSRIVFVRSPVIAQIVAGIAAAIWYKRSKISSVVDSAVSYAFRLEDYEEIFEEDLSEIKSAVYDEVFEKDLSEIKSVVYDEVYSKVSSAVKSAVSLAVYSEVYQ